MRKVRAQKIVGDAVAFVEAMESRRLLSSTLAAGVLTITGTSGNDVVALSVSGSSIKVVQGSSSQLFITSAVSKIVADLKAGNDKLTIASGITKPTSLQGGTGNDTMSGGGGKDTIRGGDGNDVLSGNNGDDLLDGNNGIDSLFGGAGNDSFTGGPGNDSIDGGAGSDTVDYSARSTKVYAELYLSDNTHLNEQNLTSTLGHGGEGAEQDTYASIETIVGGSGPDELDYAVYNDVQGGAFAAIQVKLVGGPGNDRLTGDLAGYPPANHSQVTLHGGIGNDELVTSGSDKYYLYGDDGNDEIRTNVNVGASPVDQEYLSLPPTVISGGNGVDQWDIPVDIYSADISTFTLDATMENATVIAGLSSIAGHGKLVVAGNSLANRIIVDGTLDTTVLGGAGNDSITGGDGNDSLNGDTGNDIIKGGAGNDSIQAGFGNDSILGEAGNDTLDGDIGGFTITNDFDTLDGGTGNDFIWATDTGHSTMFGGDGNDTISGSGVSDVTDGGAGNDSITGSDGNDTLNGGSGNDSISGAGGADLIHGNAGNDTITGGAGIDNLFGDDGNDTFYSKDSVSDNVNGGAGTDKAKPDVIDALTSIESIF